MARAGLELTVRDVAEAASLGTNTVNRFERGIGAAEASTMRLLRQALEAAGAEFVGEDGVRIRATSDEKNSRAGG